MLLFGLFVLGIHIGSFLNVCIQWPPRRESAGAAAVALHELQYAGAGHVDMVPLLSQVVLQRAADIAVKRKISVALLRHRVVDRHPVRAGRGVQPGNITGDWWTGVWTGDPVRLTQQLIVVAALAW